MICLPKMSLSYLSLLFLFFFLLLDNFVLPDNNYNNVNKNWNRQQKTVKTLQPQQVQPQYNRNRNTALQRNYNYNYNYNNNMQVQRTRNTNTKTNTNNYYYNQRNYQSYRTNNNNNNYRANNNNNNNNYRSTNNNNNNNNQQNVRRNIVQNTQRNYVQNNNNNGNSYSYQYNYRSQFTDYEFTALNYHNKLRSMHRTPAMSLDPDLNNRARGCAQYYAKHGKIDHSCNQKNGAGENLYVTETLRPKSAVIAAVNAWYREKRLYKDYSQDYGFSTATGHFTQLIWEGSRNIGIGVATRGGRTFVTVLYYPPGNYRGQFSDNVKPPVRQ